MNAESPEPRGYLLVVDDDENSRDMLSRRLQLEDFETATAADGYQALELIKKEAFDLIVLDVMMPGISGLEVLQKLRETHTVADLPVVMATAKDASGDVVEALGIGANDYVTKPLDIKILLARIETQLSLLRLRRERDALMELKDEFISIASHDLKSPITSVLGFARVLAMRLPPGTAMTEEMYACLDRIVNASHTMRRIVEDFLDFQALRDGRIELDKKPIDLNVLGEQAVESHGERAADKQIELRAEFAQDLPQTEADQPRVAQVVQNYIDNAIKFGEAGTIVTVRTRCDEQNLVFEVSDTGPGLTEHDLKKVFGKYAKLSNKPTKGEKSSGLGLSICKALIELHGGQVGVYNNPVGPGATFWLALPSSVSP